MSYDSVYGVFHLKTIRINVLTAEIGANFSTKKLEDMWNCILRHFHQKAYIMFNEYVQLQQRRGNKPYNIPLITRPSILKANKQKLIPTRFQNKKTS